MAEQHQDDVLEGMVGALMVGAGNGLRENAVLADIVADVFGMPMRFPRHREEAAYGAALIAVIGAGVFPDVASAGQLVQS